MCSLSRSARLRVRGRAQLVGKAVYGKTKTDQRSRLGHTVADKLVYAHEALHLREKLQSASYVRAEGRKVRPTRRTSRAELATQRLRALWVPVCVAGRVGRSWWVGPVGEGCGIV